ncbi:MAG TPA: hypothetical protein VJT50_06960 [Pyrinomonadaceae bacterium]|nr:hypothetical protein [Pyrinomonadaceae bacterium]
MTASLAFAFAPAASAKSWRGLTPLRSTRADVEKLLGKPQPGSRNFYKTTTETVSVAYAETPCAYGWRVPLDTVISLMVTPKEPLKLADLKLNEANYDKRKDLNLENIYYYVDVRNGLNWTVDTSNGTATAVEYYPAAKDARLKCPLLKSGQTTPGSNQQVTPRARRSSRSKKKSAPKVSSLRTAA